MQRIWEGNKVTRETHFSSSHNRKCKENPKTVEGSDHQTQILGSHRSTTPAIILLQLNTHHLTMEADRQENPSNAHRTRKYSNMTTAMRLKY